MGIIVDLAKAGISCINSLRRGISNLFTTKTGDEHVIRTSKEGDDTELRAASDGTNLPNKKVISNGEVKKIDEKNGCTMLLLQQSKKPLQDFIEAIGAKLDQNGGKLTDEQIVQQLDLRREFCEGTGIINKPRKVDIAILQCFSNRIVENCFKSYIDAGWEEKQLLKDPKAFENFVKYVFDYAANRTDSYSRELSPGNHNRLQAITAILFHNRDALSVPHSVTK